MLAGSQGGRLDGRGEGFSRWIPVEALLLAGLLVRLHDKVRDLVRALCRCYSETAPRDNISGQ